MEKVRMVGFGQAVKLGFKGYVNFSGRSRRSEYWWWSLFEGVVSIVAVVLDSLLFHSYAGDTSAGPMIFLPVVSLGLALPSLAVLVRRLHDTDRSGWWVFIGLIPLIGHIVLLVFELSDSRPQPNRWGPSPKYPNAGGFGQFGGYPGQPQMGYDQFGQPVQYDQFGQPVQYGQQQDPWNQQYPQQGGYGQQN